MSGQAAGARGLAGRTGAPWCARSPSADDARARCLLAAAVKQRHDWILAGGRPFDGLNIRRERDIAPFFDGMAIPRPVPPCDYDLSPLDILSS